ncbi:ABC transporter ATP-binding protein [Nonomuraea sediminis]|uniref:ABC transporter ATP-binding protein n=1 Tax=Nonomuraea sediminis TaxID=2835864 RepID=UPI001BDC75CE|nr:ABC transporter ATP-binding protein [Nonomuraea sediminis]
MVLAVHELSVDCGPTRLVDGVSLAVEAGATRCVVGESGSGKSITAMAVMGLLPRGVAVSGGRVLFGGRDLAGLPEQELRRIRGLEIGLVAQDPMTTLDPLVTVERQVADAVRAHDRRAGRAALRARVAELLRSVGISGPAGRYPHEFSGGMRQRVGIAMAIANRPRLIIADEPTTALDVTVQAQILDLLDHARAETGAAVLLITHDLGLVAERADAVTVMYAGRVVEQGSVDRVLRAPRHPYTLALLGCSPGARPADAELIPIPGQPARPGALPAGCAFHPRCGHAREVCRTRTPSLEAGSACHFHAELEEAARG